MACDDLTHRGCTLHRHIDRLPDDVAGLAMPVLLLQLPSLTIPFGSVRRNPEPRGGQPIPSKGLHTEGLNQASCRASGLMSADNDI